MLWQKYEILSDIIGIKVSKILWWESTEVEVSAGVWKSEGGRTAVQCQPRTSFTRSILLAGLETVVTSKPAGPKHKEKQASCVFHHFYLLYWLVSVSVMSVVSVRLSVSLVIISWVLIVSNRSDPGDKTCCRDAMLVCSVADTNHCSPYEGWAELWNMLSQDSKVPSCCLTQFGLQQWWPIGINPTSIVLSHPAHLHCGNASFNWQKSSPDQGPKTPPKRMSLEVYPL